MRLIIAAGGTGGHLFPGLAVAEELKSRDGKHEIIFLGAKGGIEERVVPRFGHHLELLPSLKGGLFTWNMPSKTLRLCKGYLQARRTILCFDAQVVIGLGGYASVLPILASWGVEVPCMILEQNAIPGRTTRKLAALANEVGLAYMEAAEKLPRSSKVKHVGNPLRRKVADASYASTKRNIAARGPLDDPTLLVIGGSQGARFLNEVIVKAWPKLKKMVPSMRVNLISGPDDADRTRGAFAAAGMRGKVVPYCEEMETLYGQADVVLARAGATTQAELAAFALPSILVPYPYAVDDHQAANARIMRLAGASWSLGQRNLEVDRLAQRIADIVLQPDRRRRMAEAASRLARTEAAATVVDHLECLAGLRPSVTPRVPPSAPFSPDPVRAGVA